MFKESSNNMKKIQVFGSLSICSGFEMGEFSHFDTKTKNKLIELMSRISEKSYRRGFQHGKLPIKSVEPEVFRFKTEIDHSPYADTFKPNGQWASKSGHSAISRLFMEYGELTEIGLINTSMDES